MDKLFSEEQLDRAINDLPNNGNALAFNDKNEEERKYIDAIYRHLRGEGIVKIQEAGNHVICASLTDYGIKFKFNGGFKGKEKEENKKLVQKFKFNVISGIIGTIVGYILGAVTVLLTE